MGKFIDVRIDRNKCRAADGCDMCVRVCPVDTLVVEAGQIAAIPSNEDECTLCNLCIEQCESKAIQVIRLY